MNFRVGVKLPLHKDWIDDIIDTQIKKINDILIYLSDLENGRKPDIGTLKKYRGDTFSEYHTESFKAKLLCYSNGFLFKRAKSALNGKYLGDTITTDPQNELYKFWKN